MWTNGVNTNGVTAKVRFVDGFGESYNPTFLGNGVILNATKPKSKKQQRWITTNANNAWQATLHAICMRKLVSMCTQVHGLGLRDAEFQPHPAPDALVGLPIPA